MKQQITLFKLFALLPLVGILSFLAHTQFQTTTGLKYRMNIRGYDPRDLLKGRYLRYQFDFEDRVKGTNMYNRYCFIHRSPIDYEIIRINKGDSTEQCSSVMQATKLKSRQKYFIPEAYAKQLEKKLRDRQVKTTVDLIIHNNGSFSVGQLYFDDQPWEVVIR